MTRSKWDSDLINSQQAEIERMQSFRDELIKILDWFSEHLPNEYHGFHGDENLQGETTSEMVIKTITDLRANLIGEENLLRQNVEAVTLAEQLQAELEQAYTKLRYALAAVEAVEWIGQEHAVQHCPWCMTVNLSGRHAPDCQRQLVLQMQPLKVGEK